MAAFAMQAAVAASARITAWPSAKPAKPLSLPALDGVVWDLHSLRGEVVLLHVWATWCESCRAEMPQLDVLARRYRGLQILAVNHGEGEAQIRRYLSILPVDYPILRDPDGAVLRAWGHDVLPLSVLISRDGRPRLTIEGEFDWNGSEADRLLQPLLS
jgi:thiol-disulfide isomerase/thioredoxin